MTSPLTIAVAGDVLPLRPLFDGQKPVSAALADLVAVFESADLAFANFEMPLTERLTRTEKLLNIKAPPGLAPDVARLGFDVLNVANNHSVDYGYDGLVDTVASLGRAGIPCIGAGVDRRAAASPWSGVIAGRRIAIVPFSCLLPAGTSATDDRPGISGIHVTTAYEVDALYQAEEPGDVSCVTVRTRADSDDLDWALARVEDVAATHDLVLVSLHWGFGSGEQLAEYQRPLAHAMIAAGADAILGHHPHAVHAVEIYRGAPILYSPGTFIGQQRFLAASPPVKEMWAAMSPDGYIAVLKAAGDDWSVRLVPIVLDEDGLPRRAYADDFTRISERLARLSAPFDTALEVNGDEVVASSTASRAGAITASGRQHDS